MTTNKLDNLEAAASYMHKAIDQMDNLTASCNARAIHTNDVLFEELGQVMDALGMYLVNLQTALQMNHTCDDREEVGDE